MTLDTRMYVLDRVDHRAMFQRCQELIGATDARTSDEQDPTYRNGQRIVEPGSPWTLMNEPGQGLSAWLMMHYRPGAPLRSAEQAAGHDEYCEEDCSGREHRPACWLEISFDTAYGYRGPGGEGCGDLHARVVAELGQWLDKAGVRWSWRNEFTGEVHTGYDRLVDLMSGGFEATAWFQTSALPAILRHATGGESR